MNARRRIAQRLEDYNAGRISYAELEASIRGWLNHMCYADSHGLRRAVKDVRITRRQEAKH